MCGGVVTESCLIGIGRGGRLTPCTGIREKDVPGDVRGFGSVVTQAVLTKHFLGPA